ncbi:MAG TPA: cupin domain-containing protein [Pirellulales bacterium]|nr:cupin domain-containing protein [Pirellulales bacterium]
MATTPGDLPEKYQSADFDKTPPMPQVRIPDRLHHPAVEAAGKHGDYSAERKHPVFFVDLPTHTISLTIGWLDPGQSSNMHRHTYETVLYVLEGTGYTTVEDRKVEWNAGDAVYIPVWAWHHHTNTGTGLARYLACENAPLLQNLGGVALREEAKKPSEGIRAEGKP